MVNSITQRPESARGAAPRGGCRLALPACCAALALIAAPALAVSGTGQVPTRTVLFLGDSLTAGHGIDPKLAFPALVQERIRQEGLPYEVINAGLSGETSAGGLRRIDWLLSRRIDVLVLELGANDALRGTDLGSTRRNLQAILDKVRARYPQVTLVIAGMQVPPNLGQQYTRAFRELFPALARDNDAYLIPFLLEGVGGVRELNQADGIHPNAEGHRRVAETVWRILGPVLRRR